MKQTFSSNKIDTLKPIRIFTHVANEHPGYLCEYLDQREIYYEKTNINQINPVLKQVNDVSGLIFLGSPVSVNDPLPWITEELALIRSAAQADIPVLGICFGGQLISKALGGEVHSAKMMQIGWHQTVLTDYAKAQFKSNNSQNNFYAFEWHGDEFQPPKGALPMFNGGCIKNQGFLFKGCLALQFHPEITKVMVHEWLKRYEYCLKKTNKCIQSKAQILENIDEHLVQQRLVANQIFDWWLKQVVIFQHK